MHKNSILVAAKLVVGIFLIASITIWIYQPSTSNQFVWDSYHYLVKHVWYISNLSIDNIIWMFLSMEPYWHPLTWLSWAVDYQIYGGLISSGYHLSNNVLHALNSAIVFLLALVIYDLNTSQSKAYPFRTDNRAIVAAFFASLLFAIHPQHVESVAWVAARKDLLCQLFVMLSLLTYVKYTTSNEYYKKIWLHCTLGLFVLAVLSKPMAVTFPVVLLLFDIYPLRRSELIQPVLQSVRQQSAYTLLREKLPFLLLSILLVLITLLAQASKVESISLDLRVLNAFNSILLYLTNFLVPLQLAPLYPYLVEPGETITWKALLPTFGVLGITIACVFAWTRKHHVWLISWSIYLVTLAPVIGLIQAGEQGAADRFTYLPTLPIYILIGAGILILLDRSNPVEKFIVLLLITGWGTLLAEKTRQQQHIWKDEHTLWSYAVKTSPRNVTARYNLGISYFRQQDYKNAAFQFDKSVRLPSNPTSAVMKFPTLAYRGLSYIYLSRYDEALNDYLTISDAFRTSPDLYLDHDCVYFNSGWLYVKSGQKENAFESFRMVNPSSELWPDAKIWLDSLITENILDKEELPGFCSAVFPLIRQTTVSAQDR